MHELKHFAFLSVSPNKDRRTSKVLNHTEKEYYELNGIFTSLRQSFDRYAEACGLYVSHNVASIHQFWHLLTMK